MSTFLLSNFTTFSADSLPFLKYFVTLPSVRGEIRTNEEAFAIISRKSIKRYFEYNEWY